MVPSILAEGEVIAGKYRVEHTLGAGAMGIVVAAWHVELGKRVAVKIIHPEAMGVADAAERFRREARAAANIRSEHAAKVFDVGILPSGQPYMVMEYLEGHDLAHELATRERLPIDEAAGYLLQAIEAVAEAHVGGIAHRDLKPANLFLCHRPDGSRFVKVLDFGISKPIGLGNTDVQLTRTSTLIGSPLYMSPEQMRAVRDIDPRTDIWSLGVILFELLAGRPPFLGESVPELCAIMLRDEPPPLSLFRNDVPPLLEQVILRCLAKDREQRFATVAELAHALVEFAPLYRVHADRAVGVIRTANARLSLHGSDVGRGSTRLLATPAPEPSSSRTSVPGVSSQHNPTMPGWDKGESEKPNRTRGIVLGAVGGTAVALGILVFALSSGSSDPGDVPKSDSELRPAAGSDKAPEVTPLVPQPPAPEVTAMIVPSPDPAISAPTASASAARAARPRSFPKSVATAAPAPAVSPTPSTNANSLPDFGGRR
jgi:serine/threonine-protein kinase